MIYKIITTEYAIFLIPKKSGNSLFIGPCWMDVYASQVYDDFNEYKHTPTMEQIIEAIHQTIRESKLPYGSYTIDKNSLKVLSE